MRLTNLVSSNGDDVVSQILPLKCGNGGLTSHDTKGGQPEEEIAS